MPALAPKPAPAPVPDTFSCSDADILRAFGSSEAGVAIADVKAAVEAAGLLSDADPRISGILKSLDTIDDGNPVPTDKFFATAADNLTLLHRIATKEMAIADFPSFTHHLDHLMELVKPDTSGNNADYIPILRDAPSDKFGVAFCSVDGQFYESGDSRHSFSIQSTSKPLTFALAMEKLGAEEVLLWTGIEPSGRPFNDMALLSDHRPYNPMVNSGALMTAATLASAYPDLVSRDKPTGEQETHGEELCEQVLMPLWRSLSGNGIVGDIGFSSETFLSERATADTNISLAYGMKARKGLPKDVTAQSMLDFYLRACSITANTASMAVVAATLANGGKNPITGEQVFCVDVVKKTLSVLSFCGFYDNAGEFFFHTGVPSKSGVSGVVFLVLPNVGGFAIFSPRLDRYGNSVRGSSFSKKLVDLFTFHSFDSMSSLSNGCKLDPRFSCDFSRQRNISRLRWAVKAGGKQAQKFENLLVEMCLLVALVDGNVDESEIAKLQDVYRSVLCAELPRTRVEKKLEGISTDRMEKVLDEMLGKVREQERHLGDIEKQLLIEAVVKVTTADGVVAKQERVILEKLAEALKVDRMVMELHLIDWEKKLGEQTSA